MVIIDRFSSLTYLQSLVHNMLVLENWLLIFCILWLVARIIDLSWLYYFSIVLIIFLLFVVGFSPIPSKFAEKLEGKYGTCSNLLDSDSNYIVVLGSGKSSDPDLTYLNQLYNTQLSRLVEGFRLYSQIGSCTFITSGDAANSKIPQAKVVAEAALQLGVKSSDTLMLCNAFNTESEARELRKRKPDLKQVVLVTSALHMQRAKCWFEAYGFELIPAPTDHQVKVDPKGKESLWGWQTTKWSLTNKLLHEYAGQVYANYIIKWIHE